MEKVRFHCGTSQCTVTAERNERSGDAFLEHMRTDRSFDSPKPRTSQRSIFRAVLKRLFKSLMRSAELLIQIANSSFMISRSSRAVEMLLPRESHRSKSQLGAEISHKCRSLCVEVRGQLVGGSSPSSLWFPETELESSGLETSALYSVSHLRPLHLIL